MQKGPLLGQGYTAEVYAWGEAQVLKLFLEGSPPHWIELEASSTRAAHEAGLAAPAVGEVLALDGRSGIVFERLDGVSMLQAFVSRPWRLTALARQFVELQVAMHTRVLRDLPPQRDAVRNAVARAGQLGEDLRGKLFSALDGLPGGEVVCHGDYHPGNVVMSPRGPVAIDWLTATHGDPMADVARTSLMIRANTLPPGTRRVAGWLIQMGRALFHADFIRDYRRRLPLSTLKLQAWMPIVAAARLSERVPDSERDWLLSMVHEWAQADR